MNEYLWKKLKDAGLVPQDADIATLDLTETVGGLFSAKKLDLPTYSAWCDEAKAADTAHKKEADDRVDKLGESIASKVNAGMSAQFDRLIGALGGKGATATLEVTDEELETRATAAANRIQNPPKESATNPADVFKAAAAANLRVKKATERYTHTKGVACYREDGRAPWQKANQPVQYFLGNTNHPTTVDNLSQAEYAKAGALMVLMARKAKCDIPMPEHMRALAEESLHEDMFVSDTHGAKKLSDFEVKTILDDSTSGGENTVPEWFDTALVLMPLLYGELFPYVNVIPVPRGSAADGATMREPTFVSTAEGSAITPFATASFLGAFDTNFYPATCAIEMGLDWEADSIPNMAQQIITQIGMEALRWLDEQIAVGDGTTEPQGIFTATGTSASAANGTSGALTYNDALNMIFAMSKAARNYYGGANGNRVRYVLNDTQYAKFMKIATGVTGDTRPIFGMNVKAYQLGDYPVSVQQNITSGDMAFVNLAAYRLYRRQGIQFLQDETGRTNRLAHTRLIMARMRWGGQIERPTTYVVQMLNGDTSA